MRVQLFHYDFIRDPNFDDDLDHDLLHFGHQILRPLLRETDERSRDHVTNYHPFVHLLRDVLHYRIPLRVYGGAQLHNLHYAAIHFLPEHNLLALLSLPVEIKDPDYFREQRVRKLLLVSVMRRPVLQLWG